VNLLTSRVNARLPQVVARAWARSALALRARQRNARLIRTNVSTRFFAVLLGISSPACYQNDSDDEACQKAQTHLDECEIENDEPDAAECTPYRQCVSECVSEATCAELESSEPDGDYIECVSDCNERAGREACDTAIDRLESCGVFVNSNECTSRDRCVAECVNEASCEEIQNREGAYADCVTDC
jgi:hypothetical protein